MATPRFLPSLGRRRIVGSSMSSATEQKALLERYYSDLASAGGSLLTGNQPWPIERAMREGYQRVVWVFRSVEAIAGNSSRLRFALREGKNEVVDHPTYKVLNKQANPLEIARVFRKRLSAQVLLSPKGAFVETQVSRRGDLLRADLLPPGRTVPVPGKDTPIDHFRVEPFQYGRKPRFVPVENVRWVREAHPTDPYGSITPLEAAGLSVELDHFARLYNASFMRNDGRPGGILGIKGDVEDDEMDRIESRFGGGPVDAGRLSVVAGDLDYVDTAKSPRDAQYVQSSNISKTEILVAFGVPESIIGNASGRTFANAEAEEYAFWTTTMVSHNDLIVAAFDLDSEDGLDGFLDTSHIEVLQRPEIKRREEARAEFTAGLRSPYSYAQIAGIADVESTPQTRALYLPGGLTPIPANAEDAAALAAAAATAAGPAAGPEGANGVAAQDAAAGGSAAPGGDNVFSLPPVRPPAPAGGLVPDEATQVPAAVGGDGAALPFVFPAGSDAAKVLDLPRFTVIQPLPGESSKDAVTRYLREAKTVDLGETEDGPLSRVDVQWRMSAEEEIAALFEQVALRMNGVVQARLRGQKARKGTRHWQPEHDVDTRVGEKALDSTKIVDVEQWQSEVRDAVGEYLRNLSLESAALLIQDLGVGEDGEKARITRRVAARLLALVPGAAIPLLFEALGLVLKAIDDSVRRQAEKIADLIDVREGSGDALDAIVEAVKGLLDDQSEWAKGLAVQVTTATIEGARDAITRHYMDPDILRRWRSQRDARVRPSHVKADGQEQSIGEPFEVGTSLLRYPGDPAAPLHETANCRCYLIYRSRKTGQFRARPPGERDRKGLITGATRPRTTCPGCGDVVEYDPTDGWQRLDGSISHDEGEDGATHSDVLDPPAELKITLPGIGEVRIVEEKHLPGRHNQATHGNKYRLGGADGKTRELIRAGRARLYGVTPPKRTDLQEHEVVDAKAEAEAQAALDKLLEDWDSMPDGVTDADLDEWRGEWQDEFPDEPTDTAEAAIDDEWIANWAQEWHERPWIAEEDTSADDERLRAAQAAAAEIRDALAKQQDDATAAEWEQDAATAGDQPKPKPKRRNAEAEAREQYDLYVQSEMEKAGAATRANLTNAAGKAAGISDEALFRGKLPRKYASEELLRYWADNRRLTWTEFRARALGRDSDRRRVRASQGQDNGQDFSS